MTKITHLIFLNFLLVIISIVYLLYGPSSYNLFIFLLISPSYGTIGPLINYSKIKKIELLPPFQQTPSALKSQSLNELHYAINNNQFLLNKVISKYGPSLIFNIDANKKNLKPAPCCLIP